MEMIDGFIC